MIALWPVLISRPAESRRLSGLGGWLRYQGVGRKASLSDACNSAFTLATCCRHVAEHVSECERTRTQVAELVAQLVEQHVASVKALLPALETTQIA